MKILWVTMESILPANTGGKIGMYKRVERLCKEHEIYLFYPYDNLLELSYADELRQLCAEVHPYPREKNIQTLLRSFRYPYTVASRCIGKMKQDMEQCIRKNSLDLINVDYPHICPLVAYLQGKYHLPVILNEHNIEWMLYKDISASQTNIIKKTAYYIDSWRLKKYEENIIKKMQITKFTFVSEQDKAFYQRWMKIPSDKCQLIPVGADVEEVSAQSQNQQEKVIAFIGNMSYLPNVEGAIWFARLVFPKILKCIPQSKYFIVGKNPVHEVRQLANENIIVTGTVESTKSFYETADIIVVPLLHGGGVKIKLLEAIGYGKAIVSTTKGVEGTEYERNGYIPISDDPEIFAKLCVSILNNPDDYKQKRNDMFQYFLDNYTWEGICQRFSRLLEEASNG